MNNSQSSPLHNIIYSSTATAIAELLTLPICTVKTNFQNITDMKFKPSLTFVTKDIYYRGGVKAFYAASFPAIAGQIVSTTSKYTLYRYLDENKTYPVKNKFLNGMTAGVISSSITHPLDVVKVHMQMQKPIFQSINLYRGYSKTFAKIVISSTLFFPLYDIFKQHFNNSTLSAGSSAVVTTICMHPVDYLKTRHMAGLQLYQGWNPLTYYRGLSLNLMRIVPHFVITMQVIEFFKKLEVKK